MTKKPYVHQGFLGGQPYDGPEYTAHLTADEEALVNREYDPRKDTCPIDTIWRLKLTDQQRPRRFSLFRR